MLNVNAMNSKIAKTSFALLGPLFLICLSTFLSPSSFAGDLPGEVHEPVLFLRKLESGDRNVVFKSNGNKELHNLAMKLVAWSKNKSFVTLSDVLNAALNAKKYDVLKEILLDRKSQLKSQISRGGLDLSVFLAAIKTWESAQEEKNSSESTASSNSASTTPSASASLVGGDDLKRPSQPVEKFDPIRLLQYLRMGDSNKVAMEMKLAAQEKNLGFAKKLVKWMEAPSSASLNDAIFAAYQTLLPPTRYDVIRKLLPPYGKFEFKVDFTRFVQHANTGDPDLKEILDEYLGRKFDVTKLEDSIGMLRKTLQDVKQSHKTIEEAKAALRSYDRLPDNPDDRTAFINALAQNNCSDYYIEKVTQAFDRLPDQEYQLVLAQEALNEQLHFGRKEKVNLASSKSIALEMAAPLGDLRLVKTLVKDLGMDVNYRSGNFSLLNNASNIDLVKCLVDLKADVNLENYWREPPLVLAARNGEHAKLSYLINEGKANINQLSGFSGDCSAFLSAYCRWANPTPHELKMGASSTVHDYAAIEILLFDQNGNPRAVDDHIITGLANQGIAKADQKLFELLDRHRKPLTDLAERSKDAWKKNPSAQTLEGAIRAAYNTGSYPSRSGRYSQARHNAIFELLFERLDSRKYVSRKVPFHFDPSRLLELAQQNKDTVFESLLTRKALNFDEDTFLDAVDSNNVAILKKQKAYADAEGVNFKLFGAWENILGRASRAGNLDLVRTLVTEFGMKVDHADRDGSFPLFSAHSHPETARFLVDSKADVNQCDRQEQSPLQNAARVGTASVVSLLANAGARLNHLDKDGKSAFDPVEDSRYEVIKALIFDRDNLSRWQEIDEEIRNGISGPVRGVNTKNPKLRMLLFRY